MFILTLILITSWFTIYNWLLYSRTIQITHKIFGNFFFFGMSLIWSLTSATLFWSIKFSFFFTCVLLLLLFFFLLLILLLLLFFFFLWLCFRFLLILLLLTYIIGFIRWVVFRLVAIIFARKLIVRGFFVLIGIFFSCYVVFHIFRVLRECFIRIFYLIIKISNCKFDYVFWLWS